MMQETILKSYSKKGHGQCETYEVKGGFADEKVLIEPTKRKKSGKKLAILREIITPSEHRIEARCKHASTCGGCSWQQMEYEHQLQLKQDRIASLFSSLATPESICKGPLFEYRSKMQFSFSQDKAGNQYLGDRKSVV